eukprot:4360673-Prymnesium_polylepis.1
MQLAAAQNVSFLAALDVDEFAAPFADRCLTTLLRSCKVAARCGGLSLNWRWTEGLTEDKEESHEVANETFLQAIRFRPAALNHHVKTIARVAAHRPGSFAVHNNVPQRPFCLMGEDMRPIRRCFGASWARPPTGRRAVVLHTRCTTLLDWVFRRSMRGTADAAVSATRCPTCSGSFASIRDEFR